MANLVTPIIGSHHVPYIQSKKRSQNMKTQTLGEHECSIESFIVSKTNKNKKKPSLYFVVGFFVVV